MKHPICDVKILVYESFPVVLEQYLILALFWTFFKEYYKLLFGIIGIGYNARNKTNRKFGAGNPCAGHKSESVSCVGILYGLDIIDGILGAVLETGSKKNDKNTKRCMIH